MFILFPLAKPARVIFIPKAVFTEKSVGAEREIIILTPNFALLRRISDDTLPVNSKMLSDGLKSKIKGDKPTENVVKKCTACGAPISGYKGQIVSCQYCDTNQNL